MWTPTNDVVIAAFAFLAVVLFLARAYLVHIAPDVLSRIGATLLAVACPPWYLIRRRRWVGAALVGLVWIVGVTFVGRILYAMVLFPPQWLVIFLAPGLLVWLVSGLLALLWAWWSLVGAIVWLFVAWTAFVLFSIFGGVSTLTYTSMWTPTNDVVIAAFAFLAAVLLLAGAYLVYIAPDVLSEAALQVAVATGVVRPAKKLHEAGWVGGVFKSTRWLFVLVALAAFLVGSVTSRVCPKATKASEALSHCETP